MRKGDVFSSVTIIKNYQDEILPLNQNLQHFIGCSLTKILTVHLFKLISSEMKCAKLFHWYHVNQPLGREVMWQVAQNADQWTEVAVGQELIAESCE